VVTIYIIEKSGSRDHWAMTIAHRRYLINKLPWLRALKHSASTADKRIEASDKGQVYYQLM
jgi:hypothetical protein